jgi:hypothetical protein
VRFVLSDDVTQSDQSVTELGQPGRVLIAELADAHEAKATAEDRIERVRSAIELLMGDAEEARVDGLPVVTRRTVIGRRFDAQTAKRFLTPEQVEACMVGTETRPFRRVQ